MAVRNACGAVGVTGRPSFGMGSRVRALHFGEAVTGRVVDFEYDGGVVISDDADPMRVLYERVRVSRSKLCWDRRSGLWQDCDLKDW